MSDHYIKTDAERYRECDSSLHHAIYGYWSGLPVCWRCKGTGRVTMSDHERIYLQQKHRRRERRTWTEDRMDDDDTEYVRADSSCGDCRLPIIDSCKCEEHLRICEEQQRAERAEGEVADTEEADKVLLRAAHKENAALKAEVERATKERDEWERKSKRNGLAGAILLELNEKLEAEVERLKDELSRTMHPATATDDE